MVELVYATINTTFALIVILILIIAQVICYHNDWKPSMAQPIIDRKGSYVTIVFIFACLTCNTISSLAQLLAYYTCYFCYLGHLIYKILFIITRCINQLFFIHRAKVAQDFQPILSEKWFDYILPTIVILLQALCLFGVIYFDIILPWNAYDNINCISHPNSCPNLSFGPSYTSPLLYIANSLITLFIGIIILILFLNPLFVLSSIPDEVIGNAKQKTRHEYKAMHINNVILVTSNLVLTQFMVSVWSLYPAMFWYMTSTDNMLNALTMYLIPGRNRQWHKKMCYYMCEALCCNCFFESGYVPTGDMPWPMSPEFGGRVVSKSNAPYPMELVHGDLTKIRASAVNTTQTNVFKMKSNHRTTSICSDIDVAYDYGFDNEMERDRGGSQWRPSQHTQREKLKSATLYTDDSRNAARLYTDDSRLMDTCSMKHVIAGSMKSSHRGDDDDDMDPKVTRFMTVDEFETAKKDNALPE
eukprot:531438_1